MTIKNLKTMGNKSMRNITGNIATELIDIEEGSTFSSAAQYNPTLTQAIHAPSSPETPD